jgi:hypothetical protein
VVGAAGGGLPTARVGPLRLRVYYYALRVSELLCSILCTLFDRQ